MLVFIAGISPSLKIILLFLLGSKEPALPAMPNSLAAFKGYSA